MCERIQLNALRHPNQLDMQNVQLYILSLQCPYYVECTISLSLKVLNELTLFKFVKKKTQ